jgi:large subunit ribosomal protein L10
MNKAEKTQHIELLKQKFDENSSFYITDSSTLSVAEVNELRRACFEAGIEVMVVKNTLAKKALETFGDDKNFEAIMDVFTGPTTLMFTEIANAPAKVIEEYRKSHDKPVLKAAYIDSAVFIGDDQIKELSKLKSKEELIGEIIGLLQSPMSNVLGALQSGGQTISGLVKALQEREG